MPVLVVQSGPNAGSRFDLSDEPVTIGRSDSNAIAITDYKASRVHAQFEREEAGAYIIRDLNSSNGTRVNGTQVTEAKLAFGDEVQVGNTVLIFEPSGQDEAQADASKGPMLTDEDDWIKGIVGAASAEGGKDDLLENLVAQQDVRALRKAQESLVIISKITADIGSIFDLNDLLPAILDSVLPALNADRGFIALCDPNTGEIDASKMHSATHDDSEIAVSRTMLSHVIETAKGVLTSNALEDERFKMGLSIAAQQIHSAMCVPLKSKDQILGVLQVDTRQSSDAFNIDDLNLLTIIAQEAAVAVENARLVQENLRAERLAAVGQTVAGLAHDIKNILQGMKGGSLLVQQGIENQDFALLTPGWEVMDRNEKRLTDLVFDMLNFSKDREPEYELSDLNGLTDEVALLMHERAARESIEVVTDLDESILLIEVDAKQIHRALLNLVSNAIDAIEEEEGRVTISTRWQPEGEHAEVAVTDTGTGIPEDKIARIFDVFESSKGSRGTGLGLAMVKKILDEHGGDIAVESEVGVGTTFRLSLPKRNPTEPGPEVAEAEDDEMDLETDEDFIDLETDQDIQPLKPSHDETDTGDDEVAIDLEDDDE